MPLQFVKGAHILTAGAVMTLALAAIPTIVALSNVSSSPAETKIVGPVEVSFAELKAVRDDVANLSKEVGDFLRSRSAEDRFRRIEEKLATIDATLTERKKREFDASKESQAAGAKVFVSISNSSRRRGDREQEVVELNSKSARAG